MKEDKKIEEGKKKREKRERKEEPPWDSGRIIGVSYVH